MKTGKITASNKALKNYGIPLFRKDGTERFYKRCTVWIFGEEDDGILHYLCGDSPDDEFPYYIPASWVILV